MFATKVYNNGQRMLKLLLTNINICNT